MTDYPEHEKLKQVTAYSQRVGEFLDWLSSQGVHLMKWTTFHEPVECWQCAGNDNHKGMILEQITGPIIKEDPLQPDRASKSQWVTCPNCNGTQFDPERTSDVEQWAPERRGIQQLLADYFEIDLAKIDAEKEAMLIALRQVS